MRQHRATSLREAEALIELAIKLARSRIKLTSRDEGKLVAWRLTGEKTSDGLSIYVGSKTLLQEESHTQLCLLHNTIEAFREAGWKITAPKLQEDEVE